MELRLILSVIKLEYLGDNTNMNRLKHIFRLITIIATVLIVGAAPYLQAGQSNDLGNDCTKACCCGCSHGPYDIPLEETDAVDNSCCCSVSAPVTETEAPLAPQLLPKTNPDSFAPVMSSAALITVAEIRPHQTARYSQPLAHGPPLYVLNASFII